MIKAIIFDFGGVVFTNGTKKFIKTLSDRYQIDEAFTREIVEGGSNLGTAYREGRISRDEFWKEVLSKLKIDANADDLEKEWINGYELIQGTKAIIDELSKKYKVYYLSDNVKERIQELEKKYHFNAWFSGGIFSHEVGIRKPNPKVYELALQKARVKPEEAVFIDDKPHFLTPAAAMGIKTILFENPQQLRKELVGLGLF